MLCKAPYGIKWKGKLIKAMQDRVEYLETEFEVGEAMCRAVAEWLETGTVDIDSYEQEHHKT
jgi:hypothetical protein